jgi:phage shock protein A
MRFLELVLFRLVLWVGIPLFLLVIAVGPGRIRRWWQQARKWLLEHRLDPQEVLTRVVRQHEEHIASVREALARAEATEADITANIHKSEKNVTALEAEARQRVEQGDELGARAALFKLNLERQAADSFRAHRQRQQQHIADARRRLYQLELQLRQYEVGRSILLSQLAEARTVEQQFAIASHFDPYNAVANWQKAEGLVQEKALTARAVEQVYADTLELPAAVPATVDPVALDAELAELKHRVASGE